MTIIREVARMVARDEEGATAIEYGLIAALVAAAVATILGTLGTDLGAAFSYIAGKLTVATS